jgi:hypothetical protein
VRVAEIMGTQDCVVSPDDTITSSAFLLSQRPADGIFCFDYEEVSVATQKMRDEPPHPVGSQSSDKAKPAELSLDCRCTLPVTSDD